MNKRKRTTGHQRLPLPAPRPGADLDDRILGYARANAPARRPTLPHPWLAGLATAGIVGIAVMLVLPQQPADLIREQSGQEAPRAERAAPAPARQFEHVQQLNDTLERSNQFEMREIVPVTDADAAGLAGQAAKSAAASPLADSADALSAGQLAQRLGAIDALLQTGEEERARSDYHALRESCPDCDLPATLEEAINKYREAGSPTGTSSP